MSFAGYEDNDVAKMLAEVGSALGLTGSFTIQDVLMAARDVRAEGQREGREALAEAERRYQRSQQRWGNLKARVKAEVVSLSNPCLSTQQRAQYQNGVARLNWVLDEMAKSPDVLAEALASPVASETTQPSGS